MAYATGFGNVSRGYSGSAVGPKQTITAGGQGGSAQAWPFVQAYANQASNGMTPQQRALANFQAVMGQPGAPSQQAVQQRAQEMSRQTGQNVPFAQAAQGMQGQSNNPFALAGQLNQTGQYDPTRLLQEAQAWSAMQASQYPMQRYEASGVRQGVESAVATDLRSPPNYLQEQVAASQKAATRQLQDQYARGDLTDVQLRQRQRDIESQGRSMMVQVGQQARQQAIGQGMNYMQMDAAITQQGIGGIVDVLMNIMRLGDDSAQQQANIVGELAGGRMGIGGVGGAGGWQGGLRGGFGAF